jgi:hypothetical protein
MKHAFGARLALSTLGLFCAAGAQAAGGLAVGVKAGTAGIGVEAVTSLNSVLNLRGVGNFFNYDYDTTEDGVDYQSELELRSYGLLLDLHPFKGRFRISAGGLGNGNGATLVATCPGACEVGDVTIRGNDARLDGAVDFKKFAPYVGLGFGNAMVGSGLYGIFDIGVMFQGEPDVALAASGSAVVTDSNGLSRPVADLSTDPEVQTAVAQEQASLQDDLKDFQFYPVVNIGIGYRFF